ncbi:hypothetical protein HDU92_006746 [Lobulomyces angularis]|nr:hypothetical protein HDU92_006746 [Lobulomyces angularis]
MTCHAMNILLLRHSQDVWSNFHRSDRHESKYFQILTNRPNRSEDHLGLCAAVPTIPPEPLKLPVLQANFLSALQQFCPINILAVANHQTPLALYKLF